MSTCNVNTLLSDGKAFATLDARQQQVAIAQLLCDISAAGGSPGGGGETKIIPDGTDPNGTETALEGIRYDSLGNFWAKTNDVSNATGWERFITASTPAMAPMADLRLGAPEPISVSRVTLPASPEMPAVVLPPTRPNRLKRFMSAVKTFLLSFFSFLPALLFLCVLNPLPANAGFPPPLLYQFCTTNGPTALTNILNSILSNKASTNDSRSLSFSGSNWLTGTLDLEGPLRLTNSTGTSGQFLVSAGAGKAPFWTPASSAIPTAFFFQTNAITGGITNGSAGDDIHISGNLFDNNQTNKRVVSVDNNSIVLGNANGDGPASFANGAATIGADGAIRFVGPGTYFPIFRSYGDGFSIIPKDHIFGCSFTVGDSANPPDDFMPWLGMDWQTNTGVNLSIVNGNGDTLFYVGANQHGTLLPLTLDNSKIVIGDSLGGGSASFANGAATIGADGSAHFGTFATYINPNGAIFLGGDDLHNGALTISAANGDPEVTLNGDGSLSLFVNGLQSRNSSVGGTLKVNTTVTGNIGAGEDDLISYTIPANTLANDGEYLEFDCWGSFAANAHLKELKVYFDGDTIFDSFAAVFNNKSWRAHGKIVRTSATTQAITCEFTVSGTLLGTVNCSTCLTSSGDIDLVGSDQLFKCTGEDSDGSPSSNSIVQNGMVLKWYPAQ